MLFQAVKPLILNKVLRDTGTIKLTYTTFSFGKAISQVKVWLLTRVVFGSYMTVLVRIVIVIW